ncbi:MAG: N-acetylglucosamine-6-phosphate deacetylase [Gemmatimonadaceae bacterium]|nr:N-acetylglucosamine-6-phosphate deacetylase [Chitinophagaceae bacterium]
MKAYYNGRIFTGEEFLESYAVLVENGMVSGLVEEKSIPANADKIDLNGHFLAPALIDLQIYGGNDFLFSEKMSIESLEQTYQYCLAGGCAYFMITLATNSLEKFVAAAAVVNEYWVSGKKGLLGLHLEGPYINAAKKGAHIESFVRRASLPEVKTLIDDCLGTVKMITVAPEVCSDAVIDYLLQQAIIVSAGHSAAKYEEAKKSFDNGVPAATHLYNAMSPLQHREPGLVGAILDHDKAVTSVVADGIHVDFAAIRIAKKVLGPRMFLITDAVTTSAEGEYQHVFNKDHYTLPNGILSGSALTMMNAVANCVQHAGIEIGEALRMGSLYPAKLAGMQQFAGRIKEGYEAKFVEFNDNFGVVNIYTD